MERGPGETKTTLEDVFNFLQDKAQRQAKALKMSTFSRHAYALCAPSTPQIRPSRLDLLQYSNSETAQFLAAVQPYTTAHTRIPVDHEGNMLASAELVLKHWRKAGFHSNRDAAAALAFVQCHQQQQPQQVEQPAASLESDIRKAWAGSLLFCGGLFLEPDTDRYILSFGFKKYAVLAMPLKARVANDEASLTG